MSKIKRNLGYQTFYQLLVTCMPLITSPYLSRILGAGQLGVFSFTNSVVSYFILFAMLGIVSYGTRSIAISGEDREKRSATFWEIFIFQFCTTAICSVSYCIYIIWFCQENRVIALIQGVNLIAVFSDINWLFWGVEDFKVTVQKNAIIKVISVMLILLLVKNPSELWIYSLIMGSTTFFSNIVLWHYAGKVISFSDIKKVRYEDIVQHIKPVLILFVPLLGMQIYHVMDKTMLGALRGYEESGFYYNADKVVSIPVGIINGFAMTMLPKMSALIGNGEKKKSEDYLMLSIKAISMVTAALSFGIASISNEFVPFFFGAGYENCIILIILLAPILVIKGYCYVARLLYLIPGHLEKIYTGSIIAGAAVNLVANFLLIPIYGAMGAVLGTVLAELVSCIWQYVLMKKHIKFSNALLHSFIYLLFGFIMFFVVRLSSVAFINSIASLVFEVAMGAASYITMCVIYWKVTRNSTYFSTRNGILNKISNLSKDY